MDLIKRVSRKKYYANSSNELHTNRLSKSMEIFDLAAMGTGAGLGYGVFILAGHVAHYQAGPAVSLSVFCAILVAIFAGTLKALAQYYQPL
jgi:solute carrier family 7 (cationic amino acid transporter), member 3